jgi:hypothetical protein
MFFSEILRSSWVFSKLLKYSKTGSYSIMFVHEADTVMLLGPLIQCLFLLLHNTRRHTVKIFLKMSYI